MQKARQGRYEGASVVVAARNSISKYAGNLPTRLLIIIPLAICFTVIFAGIAWADTLVVSSEPGARGSVTPGADNIVMQRLTLKTGTGSAIWTALRLNEYGTGSATTNVQQVKIYKETNGVGDIQFNISPDTVTASAPNTFTSEETNFTFNTPQTISTTPDTYYIVYSLSPSADTSGSPTVGSELVDQSYITIDKTGVNSDDIVQNFSNLQSRELTIVQTPHATSTNQSPFSSTTNLCETCHAVHLAPDFGPDFGLTGSDATRRLLVQPYFESPSVVNNYNSDIYNALCFSCHDGTGASASLENIKSSYDSTATYAGHQLKSGSSFTTGWKAPPSGQPYNAGVKMPCMVCHDVHSTTHGNYKMMADGLYDYSVSTSTGGNWIDPDFNNRISNSGEACQVCHKYSTETSRTVEVMGVDIGNLPPSHDGTTTGCIDSGCHATPHAPVIP